MQQPSAPFVHTSHLFHEVASIYRSPVVHTTSSPNGRKSPCPPAFTLLVQRWLQLIVLSACKGLRAGYHMLVG